MKPQIIIVCGPTASGKSELSIKLANHYNGEIISADSLAIYKELDIGTAKPTILEQQQAKHHLINVVEPTDTFSVFDYETLALKVVNDLLSKNKTPIICGGTGFYINSILYKMGYGNSAENTQVREKYLSLAKEKGVNFVFEELKKVDPESALKLHPNDVVRVVRALEIYYATGRKKSEQNDKLNPRFSYVAVMKDFPRKELYYRIDNRVDVMIENGLYNEVKSLIDKGITISNQCMQGIGYKEVYEGFKTGDFTGVADTIKLNSRHYAKRQITFFKRLENLNYISCDTEKAFLETVNLVDNYKE